MSEEIFVIFLMFWDVKSSQCFKLDLDDGVRCQFLAVDTYSRLTVTNLNCKVMDIIQ